MRDPMPVGGERQMDQPTFVWTTLTTCCVSPSCCLEAQAWLLGKLVPSQPRNSSLRNWV